MCSLYSHIPPHLLTLLGIPLPVSLQAPFSYHFSLTCDRVNLHLLINSCNFKFIVKTNVNFNHGIFKW